MVTNKYINIPQKMPNNNRNGNMQQITVVVLEDNAFIFIHKLSNDA